MQKSTIIFHPADIAFEVTSGITIAEAALKAGFFMRQGCSGKHLCGLCKIKILKGDIEPPGESESSKLSEEERKEGIRLGCKTIVNSDMEVELLDLPKKFGLKIDKPFELDEFKIKWPNLYTLPLTLNPPDLSDNLGDLDRVLRELSEGKLKRGVQVRPEFLSYLSKTLREADWKVGAVIKDNVFAAKYPELIDIVKLDAVQVPQMYGIALDIGTTTMAGYLVDLNGGKLLQSTALQNPQVIFGSDVITRLQVCKTRGEDGIQLLHKKAIEGCKQIIEQLCSLEHIDTNSIYCMTVVGNTVMQHLLLGLNPALLAQAPYNPASTSYPPVEAHSIGMMEKVESYHFCSLQVLPGVAGYFGADAVSCALVAATRNNISKKSAGARLCIDIGTNGEVILETPKGRLLGCSTAAGPAFEGGHIKFGMPAVPGAISSINFESGQFNFDVIGPDSRIVKITSSQELNSSANSNTSVIQPQGLTGAALIELITILLEQDSMEPNGILSDSGKLESRIIKTEKGPHEFVLYSSEDKEREAGEINEGDIVLTQLDIREIQLAKGAICAGVRTLMEIGEVEPADIESVLIAGAFGSKIPVKCVKTIGLIPTLPEANIEHIGNAAGAGAAMAMVDKTNLQRFIMLSEKMEHIELATDDRFNKYFIDSLKF